MRSRILLALAVLAAACGGRTEDPELRVRATVEFTGAPAPGVAVQVDGSPWMATGPDGTVSLGRRPGAAVVRVRQTAITEEGPVEALWELPVAGGRTIEVEVGLQWPGPTAVHQAVLRGTFTGLGGLGTALFVSPAVATTVGAYSPGDGFEARASWFGPATATVVLHGFGWQPLERPQYAGYATARREATGGADIDGVTLALRPVPVARIRGTVAAPAFLPGTPIQPEVRLAFPDGAVAWLGQAGVDGGAYDVDVPLVAGAQARLRLTSWSPEVGRPAEGGWSELWQALPAAAGELAGPSLALPEAAALLAPAEGATVGEDALFTWGEVPGAAWYALDVRCQRASSPGPGLERVRLVQVVAGATSARLPARDDLEGLQALQGASCTWRVLWTDVPGTLAAPAAAAPGRLAQSASRPVTFR